MNPSRALLAAIAIATLPVHAAGDVAAGKRTVAEKGCEACHSAKVPGATGAIYLRKDRKVTSVAKLKAQVAACNHGMGLGLLPDDEESVVAFLNETYYRFK